ncbi:MAG: hypothetical protein JTJ24_05615, partial [Collinsella sp.]|nr:hypothetical protein [Collinsella sp.]
PPVVERLHRVLHVGGSFRDAVARSHLVAVALHYNTAKCLQEIFFRKDFSGVSHRSKGRAERAGLPLLPCPLS